MARMFDVGDDGNEQIKKTSHVWPTSSEMNILDFVIPSCTISRRWLATLGLLLQGLLSIY